MAKINNLESALGPLKKYFLESTIYEILIDSHSECYFVDKNGMKSIDLFKSNNELEKTIDNILEYGKVKKKEDVYNYYVRLDELSFCHIVLPPIAIKGPSLTLMKLPTKEITIDDLIKFGAIDEKGRKLLVDIAQSQKGFLVSGNVGSGKTTLMNIMLNLIPENNRMLTLEKTPDLILKRKFVSRLQLFNNSSLEVKKIIRLGHHMRADYAVLIDTYLDEVATFIELVKNNCSGVMLLNGQNVLDSIKNLESKIVLSSEGQSFEEARYSIAQSFPYIIHQEKGEDGKRRITNISKIEYKDGSLKLVNLNA